MESEADELLHGADLFGDSAKPTVDGVLRQRFLVPPFSVLDARQGEWQERKRLWISLGIKSELGRGDLMPGSENSCYSGGAKYGIQGGQRESAVAFKSQGRLSAMQKTNDSRISASPGGGAMPDSKIGPDGKFARADLHMGKSARPNATPGGSLLHAADYFSGQRGDGRGRPITSPAGDEGKGLTFDGASGWQRAARAIPPKDALDGGLTYQGAAAAFDYYRVKSGSREETQISGTSIFDPTLCELAYTWFAPPRASVVDPFAGGSVRGVIANALGLRYWGCDLSERQIEANVTQGAELCKRIPMPDWICGDAIEKVPVAPAADFVFSCPPYGDLERYSDDPRDLSTMNYEEFILKYRAIVRACAKRLKEDRFACFVVGDFRDKQSGHYRGFVVDTISAFRDAEMHLYNHAILVTAVGSLPVRVSSQFEKSRKLGKTHQDVLVFVKGDPTKWTNPPIGI